MNGDKILGVLEQIRDEARQTNARLESLASLVFSLALLELADVTQQVRDLLPKSQ